METNLIVASLVTLLLVTCFIPWFATSSTTNLTDQLALMAFKSQITFKSNDPLVYNWTTKTSFCHWIGVSCSRRRQRVIALNLSNMNLQGKISPHIGNLSFLAILNLRNNSFHGQLPEAIDRLRRLREINLRYNHLEGNIPASLSQCLRLQHIFFGSNGFQGNIPKEIGNLHNLEILLLVENSLTGTIPLTIFNISTLRVFDIQENSLVGGIPTNICHKLPRLEFLYLSSNPLGGPFPASLCECASLRELYVIENYFTGSIPKDIGCLSNLEHLDLARNPLNGKIPPSVGNLSRLVRLNFINNYLSGEIPQEVAQLSRIKYLRIAFTYVSGRIPLAIFNLSSAGVISFMNNSLSGNIPELPDLSFPNLVNLNLQGNLFNGKIPSFISNASKLTLLELSHNSFSGSVPMTLGKLRFLQTLNLQKNQLNHEPSKTELDFFTSLTECRELKNLVIGSNHLNGVLPNSIGNLSTSLELFSADVTQIKGSLPISIGNLSNLMALELAGNNLIGQIPSSIGNLYRLQRLHLFWNNIEGSIPNELCQSTLLYEVLLNGNMLSGSIPSCIGNLSRMQSIDLSSNALTLIPLGIWNLTHVWYLNLSHNSLSGYLPPEIGNLMILETFNLSKNQLSGSIPGTISKLKMLKQLILSDNEFQGSIPEIIGDLGSLEYLDLSSNTLSGVIPKSLEKLPYLNYLNLSFNMLSGEVPTGGPFGNFTAQSFMGNDKLCGVPKLKLPACKRSARHQQSRKILQWLKYTLPPIASVIVLVSLVFIYLKYRVARKKIPSPVDLSAGMTLQLISYYDLLHATQNFSETNLLGIGSFGRVYKATMSDGKIVAVKVLDLQVEGALKSFDAECEVLRNVRHRNLVKIISSCSNLDFRALVLQYMPNGSLEKLLYSHNHCLDVLQRMNIIIDVALAVEYLHHGYSEPVVHCDLKPSNVLLDEDMVAHVGDFGIAKVLAKYKSMTQTATLGMMGYIAPEFGSEGRVSTKGDVFSYGIMLMEIFTRKKPMDAMFSGEWSLRQWVSCSFPDRVMEVVDADLLIHEQRTTGTNISFPSIMELALLCTKDLPEERLTMTDVVARLTKIKQQLLLHATISR